jgi:hypothetical protein
MISQWYFDLFWRLQYHGDTDKTKTILFEGLKRQSRSYRHIQTISLNNQFYFNTILLLLSLLLWFLLLLILFFILLLLLIVLLLLLLVLNYYYYYCYFLFYIIITIIMHSAYLYVYSQHMSNIT